MPEPEVTTLAEVLPDAPNSPAEQNPPDTTAVSDEGDPKPQESKGVQRRIDELTKNWREEQRRSQELLDLLKARDPKPEQKAQPKQVDPEAPVKPNIADFNDYDKFESAKDEYFEKLAEYKARKAVEGVRVQTEQQKRASEWDARQAEARKTYSDFDEVISSSEKLVTPAMAHAIVNGDAGTDIAYYLGKNPAELKRISAIQDPLLQVKELGKIEAKIASGKPSGDEETPAKPAAPRPPNPISKSSAADTTQLRDDLSPKEWLERRNKQIAAKKKG